MSKEILVPIRPHIKKFVVRELGGEPLLAKQNNLAGRQLLNMLYKKSVVEADPQRVEGMEQIQLQLSADLYVHKNRIYQQAHAGKLYEDFFKIAFLFFVNGIAPFVGGRRTAIYAFCDSYGIEEEEFKYDTAERMFHGRANHPTYTRKVYEGGVINSLLERNRQLKDTNQHLTKAVQTLSKAV